MIRGFGLTNIGKMWGNGTVCDLTAEAAEVYATFAESWIVCNLTAEIAEFRAEYAKV
jgi:hypothetical protein